VLLLKALILLGLRSNYHMSFCKVCLTVLLSTAAISMQAAAQNIPTVSDQHPANTGTSAPYQSAALLAQAQPLPSFSCYSYPVAAHIISSNANGLFCPALEPGDGSAKPGWTHEYRCSVSGNTATCGLLENPGPGTYSKSIAPVIQHEPLDLQAGSAVTGL
jgi:hypothetical protein